MSAAGKVGMILIGAKGSHLFSHGKQVLSPHDATIKDY